MIGYRITVGGSQYYWRNYYKSCCELEHLNLNHIDGMKRNALRTWAKLLIESDREAMK